MTPKKILLASFIAGLTNLSVALADSAHDSAVFQKFDGMEQMTSLSEQDKALTGAAWMPYKEANLYNLMLDPRLKYYYVKDCNLGTKLTAIFSNIGSKRFTGWCQYQNP